MTDIQIKHFNGQSWEDLFPKTKASLLELGSGKTVETAVTEIISDLANKVTMQEVDAEIEKVIGAAPEALDTLQELAEALGQDPNFATSITNAIGEKVDKISGKELSTNDFTNALLGKLNSLPASVYTKDEVDTRINNLASSVIPVSTEEPTGASVWFEVL